MKNYLLVIICLLLATPTLTAQTDPDTSGELKKWHTVTFTFDGPEVSETDEYNPFRGYRFNMTFRYERITGYD